VEKEIAIYLKDVSFSYNGITVLEKVSFSVKDGEFVSVVGPNGGGKTTLLKIIIGLLKPDSGKVKIFGNSPEKARFLLGYMPQHIFFDPYFPVTVMEVVLMGCLDRVWGGPYTKQNKMAALEALEKVSMLSIARRPFYRLSGGQRQRVLLARAIVNKPEILLLDEPTANMDIEVEKKLYEILSDLKKEMTILVATHDLGFISPLAETCICVNRLVKLHPTCSINGKLIMEMYGSDLKMVRHDVVTKHK